MKKSRTTKLVLKKCEVCGEEKYVMNPKEYAWNFQGHFCCSYTCYRKLERPWIEELKKSIGMED